MKAGAAMIDITPPANTHLGGTWGVFRPAQVKKQTVDDKS